MLRSIFEAIPLDEIALVARALPVLHLPRLLQHVAAELESSVHLAYALEWGRALMREHSSFIRQNPGACLAPLRALQKGVQAHYEDLSGMCANNMHMLDFVTGLGPPGVRPAGPGAQSHRPTRTGTGEAAAGAATGPTITLTNGTAASQSPSESEEG